MNLARKLNENVLPVDFRKVIPKPNQYVSVEYDIEQIKEKLNQIGNDVAKTNKRLDKENDGNTVQVESIKLDNERLVEELNVMKNKLKYCIPIPSIVYIIINSVILGGSLVICILQLCGQFRIWDVRYSIGALTVSLGLLITAIISLKDWKDFLNGEKK